MRHAPLANRMRGEMKRPMPGDRVLTFKLNLSEVQRTNQKSEQHPYETAIEILDVLLVDMLHEPHVVEKSVIWNGVDCGTVKIDWKVPS